MSFSLQLSDVKYISLHYPDSYYSSAASFAESHEKDEVVLDIKSLCFAQLVQPIEFATNIDYCRIDKDSLSKVMLKNILELNKNSPEILETYIPEIVRHKMYEEFQNYIFSNISPFVMDKYKDYFSVDFLTAYPYLTSKGSNILMILCMAKCEELAIKVVKIGKINLEDVGRDNNTALLEACLGKLHNVAIEIIQTGKSNPGYVNKYGFTSLMVACAFKLQNVALEILRTGEANPGYINCNGYTALDSAFSKKDGDIVALEMIKLYNTQLEHVYSYVPPNGYSILINACTCGFSKLALEILKTGKANPGQIETTYGNTPLIVACITRMSDVAIELLKTENARPEHVNNNGNTALFWARKNKLWNVVRKIENKSSRKFRLLDILRHGYLRIVASRN